MAMAADWIAAAMAGKKVKPGVKVAKAGTAWFAPGQGEAEAAG